MANPDPPVAGTLATSSPVTAILQVTTPEWTQDFPLKQDRLVLGRDPHCDISLDLNVVSQYHADFVRQGQGYEVQDRNSKNGLFLNGQRLSCHRLRHGDVLQISPALTLTYLEVPQTSPAEHLEALNLRNRTQLTLGRDPRNDTVIDHPMVSRFHARIYLQDGSWTIADVDSSNGTFVNGRQISGEQLLKPGDRIRIGPCQVVFKVNETLVPENEAGNLRLDALHLRRTTRQGQVLLQNISLSILPREFVAIVGVSGAGKTTLLDALSGLRPATQGTVMVNKQDLYKNYSAYRTEMGYVPQDDIIHRDLTVVQALSYAAQLRLPADTTGPERRARVQEVLVDLELQTHQHTAVKDLSGGQRKRVSMGVELLTKPSLFFLDEATSGLDPGTETQMMRLLRRLADQGRTVLLVTHATKNVMTCNMVVFLARGGRMAYFGPPREALTYFEVNDFDEIYLRVEGELSPQEWEQRYLESPHYQSYVLDRQEHLQSMALVHPRPEQQLPSRAKGVSPFGQFCILCHRHWTIISQDRASLALTLVVSPLLALLDFALWRRHVFDVTSGDAGQAITLAFVTVLIAVMVGSLGTMRDIVKETEIYHRERMVGLKILPYVFSKVSFAGMLAIYQAAVFLAGLELSVQMPGGLHRALAVYFTLLLSAWGGMAMGLLVSALSTNQNMAPLLTILFLVPQIVFAGAILPLHSIGPVGNAISSATVTRWGFEAMVTITGIGRDVARDPCWQKPSQERNHLTDAQKSHCICLGANLFSQCHFPGIRDKYNPAVDQPQPVKPQSPGDPPQLDPQDPDELQEQLQAYSDKVKAYTNQMQTWQDRFSTWKEKRGTAIASAEAIISRFYDNQGRAFQVNVPRHWGILAALTLGMLGLTVGAQKRKDRF